MENMIDWLLANVDNIVVLAPVTGFLIFAWLSERSERLRCQRRERAILRDCADFTPEEMENGNS